MPTLSVVIVTQNEAHNIEACLSSIQFADEIVIVDANSEDKTVALAKQFTDKIVSAKWAGCGPQKAHALSLATGDWVLCLDADERVTPELKTEIQNALANTHYTAFEIPFRSFYCGKAIRFGDWFNEYHLRLFRRDKGKIIPRLVHSRIEVEGKVGVLRGKILHYSYPNLQSVLRKMNAYSTEGALQKHAENKQAGLLTAIVRGLWTFIRGYILKLGFLDGKEGLFLAISNAEGTYYRYLKLMYLNETSSVSPSPSA